MSDGNAHSVQARFAVNGLKQGLHLIGCSGTEAVSELFEFQVTLAVPTPQELDLDEVIGQAALLTLVGEGAPRYVHGMVSAMEQGERVRDYTVYHATLVPQLWRLLHRQDCRIFQDASVEQIVQQVLEAAGVPADAYDIKLEGNQPTPTLEYCVHFRESDWAFISRILEGAGFYYYFVHDAERCVLVVANNYQFHPPVPGEKEVRYHEPSPTIPSGEFIHTLSQRRCITSTRVALDDFNPLTPSVSLRSSHGEEAGDALEVFDYPGVHRTPAEGAKRATTRLQELRVPRQIVRGGSDCLRLIPGHYYTLDHEQAKGLHGQDFMLTEVRHRVEKHEDLGAGALDERARYSNAFVSIPRKVPFRPARRTPKPSVRGVQTAIVCGPGGEEIYTDKYGRVKVQFHWDRHGQRDARSSCWIRVSQSWASQGWGAMFLPRIGDEVIVDFVDGDLDRPIITGRVYHARNMPPCTLPDDKSRSTIKSNSTPGGGGFNEIRFEDKKGAEEVYTHAERDQNEVVNNNKSTSVGADQSVTVGHDQTIKVGNNRDRTVIADETNTILGKRAEMVAVEETLTVGGPRTETIAGPVTVTWASEATVTLGEGLTHKIQENVERWVGGEEKRTNVGMQTNEVLNARSSFVQQDDTLIVVGDAVRDLRGDSLHQVGKNQSHSITGNKTDMVGGLSLLHAGSVTSLCAGDHTTVVFGGDHVEHAGVDRMVSVNGQYDIVTTGNFNLKAGSAHHEVEGGFSIVSGSASIYVGPGKILLSDGNGGSVEIGGGQVAIKGKPIKLNCSG